MFPYLVLSFLFVFSFPSKLGYRSCSLFQEPRAGAGTDGIVYADRQAVPAVYKVRPGYLVRDAVDTNMTRNAGKPCEKAVHLFGHLFHLQTSFPRPISQAIWHDHLHRPRSLLRGAHHLKISFRRQSKLAFCFLSHVPHNEMKVPDVALRCAKPGMSPRTHVGRQGGSASHMKENDPMPPGQLLCRPMFP